MLYQVSAQSNRKISGVLTDSAKVGIANVKIQIIIAKDTLTTETDQYGDFSLSKINAGSFSIRITAFGYEEFNAGYTFAEKERHKRLDPIRLKQSSRTLKEVVIKAKVNPVRFMQDTVEYNAAAFSVQEGDNVSDLMKQLPGMEVDDEYNVKTGNKPMTKLRINGEDFFTSNVKDFIGKLPAGIVSRIQVIDDFGDEANFTGIKIGEPAKMLNIVTKPGMNKGAFGEFSSDAGSNDRIGSQAGANLWNASKQSSVNANGNTADNGAGNSRTLGTAISHRDKFGKNTRAGFNYNFNNNKQAFNREQVTESLNPEGKFINDSKSDGENGGTNHNLNMNLNYNNGVYFVQTNMSGAYGLSDNQSSSTSLQSGLLRQDLNNRNSSNRTSPSLRANVSVSKKLKNLNNILTANGAFSWGGGSGGQHISTVTRYYDKDNGAWLKDSLLNRDVDSRSSNRNANFGFNYSLGLRKPKDTLARQSLNLNYNGAVGWSANEVSTFVFDNKSNAVSFVDSLSTSFESVSSNHNFGLSYNYNSQKMRYNLGMNARPNLLSNHDLRLGRTIRNNTFNYAPNLNFSRTFKEKTFSVTYNGANQNPSIQQLQPIRNAQSLQNIVVGNPDLKSSFAHNLYASLNYAQPKSGLSAQLGFNGSLTQNEIVENVSLLPDTLNSLKQITRYENVNGNYRVGGTYYVNLPLQKNKFSLGFSGDLGYSSRALIFNNQKTYGKGLNFSQRLEANMRLKVLTLNTQFSYSVSNNSNNNNVGSWSGNPEFPNIGIGQINAPVFFRSSTFGANLNGNLNVRNLRLNASVGYNANHNDALAEQTVRDNSDLNMRVSGQLVIKKSYFVDFSGYKRASYGYALANANPLIIGAGVGKKFLKDKSLSLDVRASDLLGQGNNISRRISGNTIIDSRSQQPTRVFSLNLRYKLSIFGGKSFRVDPDF
ncbi:MAG: TonB-dependent receptor [Bacteroidota bacterium]